MKKKEYVLVVLVFGILIYHELKIRRMNELLDTVSDISGVLLDESYQKEVDEEFDTIIENHLEDLDDL